MSAAPAGRAQAKLVLGEPGDAFEREADAVAEQVTRDSGPTGPSMIGELRVQRMCRACGEEEERVRRKPLVEGAASQEEDEEAVRTKTASGGVGAPLTEAASRGIEGAREGGAPLDGGLRGYFEPRFGHSFADVRVHADRESAALARSIGARAFTVGRDVFFGDRQYQPASPEGRRLIAHEITHVLQQRAAEPRVVQRQEEPSAADRVAAFEREHPEIAAAMAVTGSSASFHVTNMIVGFSLGFLEAAGRGIDPAVARRISEELNAPGNLPAIVAGELVGVVEGALADLADNISALWEIASWLFWHFGVGALWTYGREVWNWITDPEGQQREAEESARFYGDLWNGLQAFGRKLNEDPAFLLEIGDDLGQAAGRKAAEWYMTDFAEADAFGRGRMIGKPIGYLAMEIALLFLGPEEWVARGAALVSQGITKASHAAQAILRLIREIPELERVVRALGRWSDEAADAGRLVEAAATGAPRVEQAADGLYWLSGTGERLRVVRSFTREGEGTYRLLEGGRIVRCASPCDLIDVQRFARQLQADPALTARVAQINADAVAASRGTNAAQQDRVLTDAIDAERLLREQRRRYLGTQTQQGVRGRPDVQVYRAHEGLAAEHIEDSRRVVLEPIAQNDPRLVGDWIDQAGRTYDAVGPVPAQHFNQASFTEQIDLHLLKTRLDYVWIDLAGLDRIAADAVRAHIQGLGRTAGQKPQILLYP